MTVTLENVDRHPAVAPPALRFSALDFAFPDGTDVFRGLDLVVGRGELVGIVGASGCGKSTLLKLAAGLLAPTGGSVECDRSAIGYVFQDPSLLPWRSAVGNVELFAELRGVPKRERRLAAEAALARVGLAGSERKLPRALSGGMRMRVSLARSLILRPRLFLFDEPFAAVDEIARNHLNEAVMSLFADDGFTGVFVTHSVAEACYLSSRVIVLSPLPALIRGEVAIPLPYPRSPATRFEPPFVEAMRQISALLDG
jgi:NitT/TauT family transport system ATP-binding protein